jgi:hypothetical protein
MESARSSETSVNLYRPYMVSYHGVAAVRCQIQQYYCECYGYKVFYTDCSHLDDLGWGVGGCKRKMEDAGPPPDLFWTLKRGSSCSCPFREYNPNPSVVEPIAHWNLQFRLRLARATRALDVTCNQLSRPAAVYHETRSVWHFRRCHFVDSVW